MMRVWVQGITRFCSEKRAVSSAAGSPTRISSSYRSCDVFGWSLALDHGPTALSVPQRTSDSQLAPTLRPNSKGAPCHSDI
jgi:hypothetical protein